MPIYLVGGLNGGAGRSLTAALFAVGLHLHGRRTVLVRQTYDGMVPTLDPLATTLPLPCHELMLPGPYSLPADLNAGMTAMVHHGDDRFMTALHQVARTEAGDDADVVVDLCSHERTLNAAAVHDATLILLPARTSVLEIDWAVRSFAHVGHVQRYRAWATPTLLAPIAPASGRNSQMALLGSLLRDCDPDRDLLPGEPSDVVVEAPFLEEATLLDLFDERPIWQDPPLMERCRAFAAAALDRANAVSALLAEHDDDL